MSGPSPGRCARVTANVVMCSPEAVAAARQTFLGGKRGGSRSSPMNHCASPTPQYPAPMTSACKTMNRRGMPAVHPSFGLPFSYFRAFSNVSSPYDVLLHDSLQEGLVSITHFRLDAMLRGQQSHTSDTWARSWKHGAFMRASGQCHWILSIFENLRACTARSNELKLGYKVS